MNHLSMRVGRLSFVIPFLVLGWAQPRAAGGQLVMSFAGTVPKPERVSPLIDYNLDLTKERYLAYVPDDYKQSTEPYGLIVFIDASEKSEEVPAGWKNVLDRRKLIYLAPQHAGNEQPLSRRHGLAVLGALKAKQQSRIDPRRVYVAGYSGGARTACQVGFLQPDLFHGTIQCCGTEFYQAVPQVAPRPANRPAGKYGFEQMLAGGAERAKANVRFVLITGSRDFRHGDILDIYHGGFEKRGFQAQLLDVEGLEHDICSAATLNQALNFIEPQLAVDDAQIADAPSIPAATDWAGKDSRRWPQILLRNDAEFRSNLSMKGASGFLLRLPNDAVVAATAYHLVSQFKPAELNRAIISWAMYPPEEPNKRVVLQKLAVKPEMVPSLDCVLMTVKERREWPCEVLKVRDNPVEEGETVYVIGVPYSENASQLVYKGKVARRAEMGAFPYVFEQTVETRGFSGAPVIDRNGLLVGIHLGRYNEPNGRGTIGRARDISLVIEAADAQAAAVRNQIIVASKDRANAIAFQGR